MRKSQEPREPRSEQPDKGDGKPERSGKAEEPGKPVKDGKAAKDGTSERPDEPGRNELDRDEPGRDGPEKPSRPSRRERRAAARTKPTGRRLPVWWPLPALAVTGALAGGAYGALATPQYAATSYIVAVAEGKDAQPGAAIGFAQAYGRVATSDSTIAYARVAAGMPAAELRDRVRTETSPDSPMIAITGTSDRRGEAADIANAVSDAVFVSSNQVAENTGVRLLSFSRAIPPAETVSPSIRVGAAVGGAAGGLLGGLVLLVRPRARRADPGAGDTAAPVIVPAPVAATVPGPATEGAAAPSATAAGLERV